MIYVIHKLEKSINEITYIANYDLLTGLANRNKFIEDIKNYENPCFILFNIDKFQHINDIFGIKAGDEVLKFVANELKEFCKKYENCEVFRIGADDFGLLLENIAYMEAYRIAYEIIENIEKKSINLNGIEHNISLSSGISFEKKHLIETADSALKYVKKDRQKKIAFFEQNINERIIKNIEKITILREAIKNNNIIPVFQGIYDKNKNLIKYEVLARVKNENKLESIYPYLQVAKEHKLYHYITDQIFLKVFKILQKEKINVSFNISMEDMENNTMKNKILDMLREEKIANKITFEVLESEIANYENVIEFLKLIKNKGSLIAIDDFGSGYSNFERILALDVDYIKIDGSLIKNILTDKNSRLIVELIIDFAKKVNRKTVAEFVSSKEIFQECKKLGIDYYQGFYLDEPTVRFDSDKIKI
jgi:diguanylate cyclase (GGDEF)-like protein